MSGTLTDRARQIAAIVDKLKPLGAKARGMPLDAAEWNAIVDAMQQLASIDYAQETQGTNLGDQRYALKDHEHLGEVSTAWLDADLQARTASGLGTDSTARTQIGQINQSMAGLNTQVAQLSDRVFGKSLSLMLASVDPAKLVSLGNRVSGLEGLNTTVTQIATSQKALESNINAALAVRTSLNDATGKPIDIGGLQQQVATLQIALQAGLTGADGKPAKLSDLELQVVDLKNQLPSVAGGSLEGRLATLSADIQDKAAAAVKTQLDSLRTDVISAAGALSTSLTSKLEGELAASRGAGDASAAGLVAAAEVRLNASVASGIGTAQSSLAATLQANVSDALAKGTAALADQVAAVVDSRVPGIRAQLQSDLQGALGPVLQKAVADQTAALTTQLTALSTNLTRLSTDLPAQIDAALGVSMTALQGRIDQQVQTQLLAAQTAVTATIDNRVGTAVSNGLAVIPGLAAQAVKDGLANLGAQVGSAVATATAGLPAQVASALDARLAQVNLAGQIQAASSAVTAQLRGEIATSAASVQANTQAALNASVTSLRSELNTRIVAHPVAVTPALVRPS